MALLIVGEFAAPLAVLLLNPGFDHANSLGLDFDFAVWMAWLFAVLWPAGAVLSWRYYDKKKHYLYIHLVTSPLFVVLLISGFSYYRK